MSGKGEPPVNQSTAQTEEEEERRQAALRSDLRKNAMSRLPNAVKARLPAGLTFERGELTGPYSENRMLN